MKEHLRPIFREVEADLPGTLPALLRSALLGALLLSPLQADHPLPSLLLPPLLLALGLLRGLPGLRTSFLLCLAALLPLLLPELSHAGLIAGLAQGLAGACLLPAWRKEAFLPARDLEPRPGVGRVLLPLIAPLLLGSALWLPVEPAGFLLTLLESLQLIALICALSIWLTTPRAQGMPVLLLCLGKSLSTLAIPWWLLHTEGPTTGLWLLALFFLFEGEWESRILVRLAAKAEKPC